jgi:phosphoribosylformimino-5-aminoimidazole carboxamide ribonucleotide (ProFAR) isomerase
LTKLKKLGVEGAILGKALYTGDINLKEALSLGL